MKRCVIFLDNCKDCLVSTLGASILALALLFPGRSYAAEMDSAASSLVATTAAAFIDSIGVSAHWEYKDTVYHHSTNQLIVAIKNLGIKHVRGFDPVISRDLSHLGITSMLVAGPEVGTPAAIADMITLVNAHGPVIDAVEGPNEADLFWPMHGYVYKGNGFPRGVIAYQRELFQALKQRAQTAKLLVVGPSLGKTYDRSVSRNPFSDGVLSHSVDFGNFHPYPFGGNSFSTPFAYGGIEKYYWNGNFPSTNLDEFPYAREVYAPPFSPMPMAATETGYPTWSGGISELTQAKYIPRLFAEYMRLGIAHTWLYELIDIQPDASGRAMDDHFGLIRNSLVPKPSYIALQSLIKLVAAGMEPGVGGGAPDVSMIAHMPPGYDRPAYVHSLMLHQSATQDLLLIWHEVASADTSVSPPRMVEVPSGTVDLSLTGPFSVVAWYDYDPAWAFRVHSVSAGQKNIVVPLRDEIVAVLLRRSP